MAAQPPSLIDVHAHCAPVRLIERLENGEIPGVRVRCDGPQRRLETAPGILSAPLEPGLLDEDARIRRMDDAGVQRQLLSSFIDIGGHNVAAHEAAAYSKLLNDEISRIVDRHPDRLSGLASLPLGDGDAAASELERATLELGFVGAEIRATGLDADQLEPLWAKAASLASVILVHPEASTTSGLPMFLGNFVENPAETTIAAESLVLSGVLERHPALTIVLVHGGGFLPYQWGRMRHGHEHYGHRFGARLEHSTIREQLRRFYYDTILHDSDALAYLVALVGADRVVVGTDYPFAMGDTAPTATVGSLKALAEPDRRLIEDGNLRRLLERAWSAREEHLDKSRAR